MSLWAIVPVKPLRHGKSRLSTVLSEEQRWEINRRLLSHTVTVLKGFAPVEVVLVVSRDNEALTLARLLGAHTLPEGPSDDLNRAVFMGTLFARHSHAEAVLVLPADLPLLSEATLETFLSAAQGEQPRMAIAPDRHRRGTNALYLAPPEIPSFRFGENSFQAHCELAAQLGRRCIVVEVPGLAFDLDSREDWNLMQTLPLLSFDVPCQASHPRLSVGNG